MTPSAMPRARSSYVSFAKLTSNKELTPLQALPLSDDVKRINPNGLEALSLDVEHLTKFVSGLENAFMLQQTLEELQQSVALMKADNHDEFYDISMRNKKYNRVDAMNGPILIEKLTQTVDNPSRAAAPLANFGSRFGLR